jgi:hypothetical protein
MPSQFGQDYLVLDILGGMRNGFFLDSGASDGIEASNTLLLESAFGWKGICVEPNESFFGDLIRNRECYCVNCCLYDREGSVDFLERAGTLGGIVDEYDPVLVRYAQEAFHIPRTPGGGLPTVQRRALTVGSILRGCGAPKILDYWSLDTEGSELTILKSFPFNEFTFRVLTVEHNRLPVREQIRAFLEEHGYYRFAELEIDDCYLKYDSGVRQPPSWRSRAWSRRR